MTSTPSPSHPSPSSGRPEDRTAQPGRAIGSRADVVTGVPGRYAKQLVSHLGRKVAFTGDATTTPATALIGDATAGLVVGDGVLTLWAAGDDEAAVARVEQVLGGHLERFAQRETLTVRWVRTAGAPFPGSGTAATTVPEESP